MNERDAATRAETVGSLLRPEPVLRAMAPGSAEPPGSLPKILDDAVTEAIRIQEDEEAVAARLAEAATVKPLAELALSTQCGFASVAQGNPVTQAQQTAKLKMVASVAHHIWGQRAPAGKSHDG